MAKKQKKLIPEAEAAEVKVRRWWHKWHWRVLLGLAVFSLFIILVQFFYPTNRALPLAKVSNTEIGNKSWNEVIELIHQKYADVALSLKFDDKTELKTSSAKVGLTPDYLKTANQALDYSVKERLIPLSLLFKPLLRPVEVVINLDETRFNEFSPEAIKSCALTPTDAKLGYKNDQLELLPAAAGRKCSPEVIKTAILGLSLRSAGNNELKVIGEAIEPAITNEKLGALFPVAQKTVSKGLTVASPVESWPIDKKTIAAWLKPTETDGKVSLQIDEPAVQEYLEALRGKLYIEPGISRVEYENGIEVARDEGSSGQGFDVKVTAERVADVLLGRTLESTAWVELSVLPPRDVVTRGYSPTPAGLQALLTQWEKDNAGTYGILIRDLTGKKMNASFNADGDFVTASTFKMFLAYAVLHKIEQGDISFNTRTDTGLSVRACMDEMILHSTNACATSFFNLVGWSYAHNFIKSQFPHTILDNSQSPDGEKHSTVHDEIDFLQKLDAGSLMDSEHTSYLLDLLKRQIYRGGIPSGVPGITVANKVGFYAGYKHDVAIVYAPRGTYQIGIMSYGGSDLQFADLSSKVYALMKQN